ncbi:MAG: hypothetical protein WCJ92_04755 [Alphaproteobacteria bacterium]
MNEKKAFFLTLDIDRCPDYILDSVINLLVRKNIPATFFATHDTPLLQKIRKFDLSIRSDFNIGSNHGNRIAEVYKYVCKMFSFENQKGLLPKSSDNVVCSIFIKLFYKKFKN